MKYTKMIMIFLLVALLVLAAGGFAHSSEISLALPVSPEAEFIRSHVPIFEEDTGMNVFLTMYAEELYREHVMSDLVAGAGAYDIIAVDSVYIPMLAKTGMIEPIEEYFDAAWELEDYNPLVIEALSHEDILYALPYTREVSLLMYRQDLLDELELEVPQTFEDIESHAHELFHFPDIYPFAVRAASGEGNNVYAWTHWLRAFGGEFFDAELHPVFHTEEAVKATEHYSELVTIFAPEPLIELDQWRIKTMFALGAIGMTIESHTVYGNLESPALSRVVGEVGYAPVPEGPAGRYPGNRIYGLVVATHELPELANFENEGNPGGEEEKRKALKTFLQWATSSEIEQKMWETAAITSTCRDDLFHDPEFQAIVDSDWLEATLEAFEQTLLDFRPRIEEWYMTGDRLSIALEGVTTEAFTAREALTQEREQVLEEIERRRMVEENE